MSYDTKCYELAKQFLADRPKVDSPQHRDELAQAIQDVIEDCLTEFFDEEQEQ